MLAGAQAMAQPTLEAPPRFAVWQGLNQQWQLGQDLLTFGIEPDFPVATHKRLETELYAGVATRKRDSARLQAYYTFVTSPYIHAETGEVTLPIAGRRKDEVQTGVQVSRKVSGLPISQTNYTVLLQGFRWRSTSKHGLRPERFAVEVSDGFFNAADSTVKFELTTTIAGRQRRGLAGELVVQYLLLVADGPFAHTDATLQRSYFWDKRQPPLNDASSYQLKGDTTRAYDKMVPALQMLDFRTFRRIPWQQFTCHIRPLAYAPKQGLVEVVPTLHVQNWPEDYKAMKKRLGHGNPGLCRKKSVAELRARISILQFDDACIWQRPFQLGGPTGEVPWPPEQDHEATIKGKYRYTLPCKPGN